MSKKIMGVTVGTPIRPSKFATELADRVEEMVKANTEQEKTVDITENGTLEIVPDEGYKLTKVTANVNVSGDNKLFQFVDGTLTEITAEDLEGATKIRNNAFYQASTITSVVIPNSVTEIGANAFNYCIKLITITIPNSVTTISRSVFHDCTALITITIPNSVTSLGTSIFQNCNSLTSAVLPNSITTIPGSTFYNCHNLANVIIPNSVTTINSYAFYSCYNLNPTIPASVTKIETDALKCGSNTNKATITFLGTTPPTITVNTFLAQWIDKIIVPAGSGEAYRTATNWANFADYIEEASV